QATNQLATAIRATRTIAVTAAAGNDWSISLQALRPCFHARAPFLRADRARHAVIGRNPPGPGVGERPVAAVKHRAGVSFLIRRVAARRATLRRREAETAAVAGLGLVR